MKIELPEPSKSMFGYLADSLSDVDYTVSVYPDPKVPLAQLAVDAATLLRQGRTIAWEPGEGTRYVMALVRASSADWLCFFNVGQGMVRLKGVHADGGVGTTLSDWVYSTAPQGGWMGILPILVAGGWVTPPTRAAEIALWPEEQTREWSYRRAHPERLQMHDSDAALGRKIRAMVSTDLINNPPTSPAPDSAAQEPTQ